MKKFFCAVLFIVMFVVSVAAFAEDRYQIHSVTGVVSDVEVKTPGAGRAIGNTVIVFENLSVDLEGMHSNLKTFKGKTIRISYQYSEKDGARGFVIKEVTYLKD